MKWEILAILPSAIPVSCTHSKEQMHLGSPSAVGNCCLPLMYNKNVFFHHLAQSLNPQPVVSSSWKPVSKGTKSVETFPGKSLLSNLQCRSLMWEWTLTARSCCTFSVAKDPEQREFTWPKWSRAPHRQILFFFTPLVPLNRLLWLEIQFAYLCNAVRQIRPFIICWIFLYSDMLKQLQLHLSFKLKVTGSV